ncbi:hypothetical protein [Pedobacter xixiisoli]|uniref:Uncharacterized protein n=1 Tax=Pedobacter xixiisoli TaxID=1476464 RepID=A0A285ZXF7_9SPHI|nr:hypothetical protein [Pedobacter xixiisoli]SOD14318.1 hypothetical protein SAMN06297358_1514 [Pedobacter xixiisoli]
MKHFQYLILQILCCLTIVVSTSCKSSDNFSGVYAGVRLSLNPLGGGMNRTDEVFLFRKDNTFTDQLNKKDWKTAVRGTYEIKGSELYLTYVNGDKDNFTITKGGNLDAGTYVLFKMDLDNSIPKGSYHFKFINGSGGMATGTTYIGTSTKQTLNFDGKGNFDTDRQSTTVIAGDNIGGGTNTKSDGKGKYVLKDGLLTLSYENGNSTTHSFFASAGDAKNKAMAVIDGSFYFTDNESDKTNSDQEKTNAKLPSAAEILKEVKKVYGGAALDDIKTYTIEAEINGIKLVSYNDLTGNRFRNEMFNRDKLIVVEQIGPNGGWTWNNGKKTISDNERLQEIKYNDYIGVLGLQEQNNSAFSKGRVSATKDGYAVSFEVDGNQFVYLIDSEYRIIGDSYQIGKKKQMSTYSNIKTVGGIKMPFTTIASDGKNKVTLNYKSMKINEPLATKWSEL